MTISNTSARKLQVIVVMPAFNAERTLEMTYHAIPSGMADKIILVDDASKDKTVEIAQSLDLEVFRHRRNYGYGANQKTCYKEALNFECQIVVMLHPDYQYNPALLPTLIKPIIERKADVVLGSRLLNNNPMKQGMPWWKYFSNRILTVIENAMFGLKLSEYHTGYRAYARHVLEKVNFEMNSDGFVFDQEIIVQCVLNRFKIHEVAVPAHYFPEASSASFRQSVYYGFSILRLLLRFWLHIQRYRRYPQFENFDKRYTRVRR